MIIVFIVLLLVLLLLLNTKENFESNDKYDFKQHIKKNKNKTTLITRLTKFDDKCLYMRRPIKTKKIDILVDDLQYFIDNDIDKIGNKTTINILDHPFKSVCISNYNYKDFINNKNIYRIFSENWNDKLHPKLTIIPIGFESKAILDGNHELMIQISKVQKKIEDKPLKVLCNSHFLIHKNPKSGSYNQRQEVIDTLKNNKLVDFWKNKKTKEETWKQHNNYSFELCPEGNGLDTHRFYEALFLNTIPIVKKNSLESLYNQFPCVILNDLNEITESNLKKWKNKLKDRIHFEKYKLNMDYWLNKP